MMKIGILGGMTPESTREYYDQIIRHYTEQYHDHGYPEIIIYSVSFQQYVDWMETNQWDVLAAGLTEAAQQLERAGADFIIIATNTMHKVAEKIRSAIHVPLLSLLDVVSEAIYDKGIQRVLLLGTRYTMEDGFYKEALEQNDIEVMIPNSEDREEIHRVIFEELSYGEIKNSSKARYLEIIEKFHEQGVGGVILGCTEIPLLIKAEDTELAVFDTTVLHANAALRYSLEK